MRTIDLDSPKVIKEGFPPTIKKAKQSYYLMGGSLQHFYGDVKKVTKQLKGKGVNFEVVKVKNPKGPGGWLIYVGDRTTVHLENLLRR